MAEHLDRIGQQVGDYRLLRWLGGGGFGNVYLAEQVRDHSQIAVKLLQIRLTRNEDMKAFINEARTIRLKHPHIVPLLDFGISREDIPFLVMEYAVQGTLRDRYPKSTQVPLNSVTDYVLQIASALQYAHEQRLIHRDVKPENMLLRANGAVLLSDFGIASAAHSSHSLSLHQGIGGTIPYMAPEQIQGQARAASDQYSLGVVVYEWIAGRRPFEGTAAEVTMQHMMKPPPSLVAQAPTLSRAVDEVVLKALAKDPKDRFVTVQDFAAALEQATRQVPDIFPSFIPNQSLPPAIPDVHSTSPIGSSEQVLSPYPSILPAPLSHHSPPRVSQQVTSPSPSEPSLLPPVTEVGSTGQSALLTPPAANQVPASPSVPYASELLPAAQSFVQPPGQVLQPPPAAHRSNQPQGPSKMKTTLLIGLACVLLLGGLSLFSPTVIRWFILQGKAVGSPTVIPSVPTTVTPIYPPAVTNFTMFGFDPQHTHFNPAEKTLNRGNVSRLKTGWINKTGGELMDHPSLLMASSTSAQIKCTPSMPGAEKPCG
ncbi:MAG: protein kinase [Ktedonobacteraceae bacterium]|nr:protein kinase [Ktedonobacteraceae bacterium]